MYSCCEVLASIHSHRVPSTLTRMQVRVLYYVHGFVVTRAGWWWWVSLAGLLPVVLRHDWQYAGRLRLARFRLS